MAIGDLTRKKKKRGPESAAGTLDQIEEVGDRVGNWLASNVVPLVAGLGVVLLSVGAFGYWSSQAEDTRRAASMGLAAVQQGYLRDMGASPGDIMAAEPANPETAAAVRRQYVDAFRQVRNDHPGTQEALVAGLEQGNLERELGDADAAIATWMQVLASPSASGPLRGLILIRLGAAHEAAGDWPAAATYYEEAGNLPDFYLAPSALDDAARSHAEAGDNERAVKVYDQRVAAKGRPAPPHVRTRFEELRAQAAR